MPAPSYAVLFDLPSLVSAAVKAVLVADKTTLIGSDTAADPAAFIFGPREALEMPVDRIEVTAGAFTQASGQTIFGDAPAVQFYNDFSGQIYVAVQTPRGTALARAEHGKRCGRVAFLLSETKAAITPAIAPYFIPTALRLESFPRSEPIEDEDADRTELVFAIRLMIPASAYPASLA